MIPFYDWFYKVLITSANSVPIQSLWMAFFANPLLLNKAISAGKYENGFSYYTLTAGAGLNTAQGAMGALFANSVTIPGDGMNVSKVGPEGSGLIKGNISNGRKDMENVSLSFLDTNISFCDYNLRPWTVYASHKSLKDESVKTTLIVVQFTKTGSGKPLLPRAIWTFMGACPVNISSEQWNYGADNVISRTVEFSYNYYTLNADPAITPLLAAASVVKTLAGVKDKHKSQPKSVQKGGIITHGDFDAVNVPTDGKTSLGAHSAGQLVDIPDDDMVSRGINIGMDILNGNSNVKIPSDDAIERLKGIAEQLQSQIKINPDDTPVRDSGKGQVGHIRKEPTGPTQDQPDHITREAPEKEQSGRVPVGGNSKASTEALSDTPIFFPGDGDETQKKIVGRSVGGELDTPEIQTIAFQEIEIPKNGDVGKNVKGQAVNINDNDMREGAAAKFDFADINQNDGIVGTHAPAQLVNINRQDSIETHTASKTVTVNKNDSTEDSYGTPKIVNIKINDTVKKTSIPSQLVTVDTNDFSRKGTIKFQEVTISKNPSNVGQSVQSQLVSVKAVDKVVSGAHATPQMVNIKSADHIGEFKPDHQKVEIKSGDTSVGSNIKAKVVSINANDGRR